MSWLSCLIVSYLEKFNSVDHDLNPILVPKDTTLKYYSESCTLAAFVYHLNLSEHSSQEPFCNLNRVLCEMRKNKS